MLLDITPDSPAKGRTKVLIGIIAITMITANLLLQDMNLIRDSAKMIHAKMKRAQARRPSRTPPLRLQWN
jgi:hypothetical protein